MFLYSFFIGLIAGCTGQLNLLDHTPSRQRFWYIRSVDEYKFIFKKNWLINVINNRTYNRHW